MLQKPIIYFGTERRLVCDGRCDKAWGINSRPKEQLSDNPDDFAWPADDELGKAPVDPQTYEGGHAKPRVATSENMNKWCARECERSHIVKRDEIPALRDFSKRIYNIQRKTA